MDKNILFSLLHDVWGEGANESLRLTMMRLTSDILTQADMSTLKELVPEIPEEKWTAWRNYYSPERYDLRAELLENIGIQMMLYSDEAYPEALREVYRPPSLLYIKGHFELANLNIAMVGSRKATAYGKNIAYSLSKSLSNENVRIISGLAKGIDVNAHKGAVEGSGGTIAVLGCGVDRVYPKQNESVYEAILHHPNSAIISEWTLGSDPLRTERGACCCRSLKEKRFPYKRQLCARVRQGCFCCARHDYKRRIGRLSSPNQGRRQACGAAI